jgi:hypothetical protein
VSKWSNARGGSAVESKGVSLPSPLQVPLLSSITKYPLFVLVEKSLPGVERHIDQSRPDHPKALPTSLPPIPVCVKYCGIAYTVESLTILYSSDSLFIFPIHFFALGGIGKPK